MIRLKSFRRHLASSAMLLLTAGSLSAAPFITGFAPDFGPPGTQVTIVGRDLRPTLAAPRILFGNVEATLLSANNTRIVAIAPAQVPIGPITVFNAAGQYTTPFFFYAPPRIEDFGTRIVGSIGDTPIFEKPVVGTPGSTLTILGGNFFVPGFPGIQVRIGNDLIQATATAENQILATIPPIVQTGHLSVRTSVGGTTNLADYIYGNPRIEAFTPRAAAGDTIALMGLNFLVSQPGQLQLRIGGALVTQFEVVSNTNLNAVVPLTAATGPLSLTAPGGSFITTTNFTLLPRVTTFSPNFGPPGTVVTLVGSGLTGTQRILFGNTAATTITNLSSAQVTAVVPAGVSTGPITLITAGGTNVTEALFFAPPQVSGFTPSSGPSGTVVTVSGANLGGATAVQLNSIPVPQFTVLDNSRIQFPVPAGAASGRIAVVTPGGTSQSAGTFTVAGLQPVISTFAPRSGPVGTRVTLIGSNLGTVTRVAFNGVPSEYTIQSAASIEATVPAGATTGRIRVTNPEGSAETGENFFVGSSTDLRVTFGATPNPAVAFGTVTFNVLVVNNGPLPAAATTVEVELPTGFAFLEAVSAFPFQVSGQRVVFNRGTVEPQEFFSGLVRANAGEPHANRVAVARASSTTPESVPGDNERQVTLTVSPPVLRIELLDPAAALLSWPAAAEGAYVLRAAAALGAPWVPVPGTPENDGATLQLEIPLTGSAQYFELDRP
ncbi:MAG: IPT/TIG domain-containing protein [Verrucomicrobiae bacterium]|nr:IPT/TIG domain-containing protein [Verrucomicrobiae bacterium]